MRINELVTLPNSFAGFANEIKKYRETNRRGMIDVSEDLVNAIEKLGFTSVGHGTFANAFEHPTKGYIIKVSIVDDVGYNAFLKMAYRSGNPHFPKIIGKPTIYRNQFLVTRMEKLARIDDNATWKKVRLETSKTLQTILTGNELQNVASSPWFDRTVLTGTDGYEEDDFTRKYPDWHEAIENIVAIYRSVPDFRIDLHRGNIMARGNVPVVIDPLASIS
jgi:hypothetical protein